MAYRTQKFSSQLHRMIAEIIRKNIDLPDALITVIDATTTDDRTRCEVHVSIFPQTKMEEGIKILNKAR